MTPICAPPAFSKCWSAKKVSNKRALGAFSLCPWALQWHPKGSQRQRKNASLAALVRSLCVFGRSNGNQRTPQGVPKTEGERTSDRFRVARQRGLGEATPRRARRAGAIVVTRQKRRRRLASTSGPTRLRIFPDVVYRTPPSTLKNGNRYTHATRGSRMAPPTRGQAWTNMPSKSGPGSAYTHARCVTTPPRKLKINVKITQLPRQLPRVLKIYPFWECGASWGWSNKPHPNPPVSESKSIKNKRCRGVENLQGR